MLTALSPSPTPLAKKQNPRRYTFIASQTPQNSHSAYWITSRTYTSASLACTLLPFSHEDNQLKGTATHFLFCVLRCDHVLVQRKHVQPRSADVRAVALATATHHPRNGRAVHGPGEYLRLIAGGQGSATIVSHGYDTVDGGICGDRCRRRMGCRPRARAWEDQRQLRIWNLTLVAPSLLRL